MRDEISFTITNDDGDEIEVALPAKYEVCPCCGGRGRSSAYLGAITQDEWYNEWSYDEQEAYLAGEYDRTCPKCDGLRVVAAPDESRANPAILAAYREKERDDAEYEAMCRMERMMGA